MARGFPLGGSCQRPRPLTDEGEVCHGNPGTGNRGELAPHPALRGHLLPFWRYAPPPPVPGESVPRGKAGNHSITSHPGKYHSRISRHVLPSSAITFAPYWLRPTPWP